MLKKVPKIISPELLKILCEMGHGDEIVIADGNFPATTVCANVVRADGHGVPEILDAVMQLIPLDTYAEWNIGLMQVVKGDNVVPVIWDKYKSILKASGESAKIKEIERFDFYKRSESAKAVVATGEAALYANIIIKKGVIK